MYRYYKYYSYVSDNLEQKCKQESMMGKPPSAECLNRHKNEDCRGLKGLLNAKCRGNPSRPYKQPKSSERHPNGTPKTLQERIAACQARVNAHIARVNASTSIPAETKAKIIPKLNAKLTGCSTPHGLDDEERDKEHKDVTERKLDAISALIDRIIAFLRRLGFTVTPPTPTA